MITNEILTDEQIKNLRELGLTVSDQVSLSDMIILIVSKERFIKLELHGDEGMFAQSGEFWCIREDVMSAVYALLCQLATGDKKAPDVILF
jgi:hypothetical protein